MIIKNKNVFHLQGKNISYIMAVNECGDLLHYYYGKKLRDKNYEWIKQKWSVWNGYGPDKWTLDICPQEYPAYGYTDLRTPAYSIVNRQGGSVSRLTYKTHKIIQNATQEIDGMIEMIKTLVDKGYAYAAKDGTVYFRVKKFKEYGKLSHKNLDDLQSGFRSLQVSGEEQKEDPLDFVLWKPKKEGEPFWTSPWCDGRPGWHIECSVMSKKYLGEEIDIHAGGEDLVFPHHENEIAQSECCNGKTFARYWLHNAFLNIDNRKMSKSLGNFRTVREISEQYDLQVLRFFMLNAHYRSPLNFSADLMEASKNALERITEGAGRLKDRKENAVVLELLEEEKTLLSEAEGFTSKFETAMEDDFNTADALAAIFELVKFANTNATEKSSAAFAEALLSQLMKLSDVLGLKVIKKEEILDKEIEALIEERQEARKAKNFARADEIRDELLEKGIILKDTREGVKWKRA